MIIAISSQAGHKTNLYTKDKALSEMIKEAHAPWVSRVH